MDEKPMYAKDELAMTENAWSRLVATARDDGTVHAALTYMRRDQLSRECVAVQIALALQEEKEALRTRLLEMINHTLPPLILRQPSD